MVSSPLSAEFVLGLLTLGTTDPAHSELITALGIADDESVSITMCYLIFLIVGKWMRLKEREGASRLSFLRFIKFKNSENQERVSYPSNSKERLTW